MKVDPHNAVVVNNVAMVDVMEGKHLDRAKAASWIKRFPRPARSRPIFWIRSPISRSSKAVLPATRSSL